MTTRRYTFWKALGTILALLIAGKVLLIIVAFFATLKAIGG